MAAILATTTVLSAQSINYYDNSDSVQLSENLSVGARAMEFWTGYIIGDIHGSDYSGLCEDAQNSTGPYQGLSLQQRQKVATFYWNLPNNVTFGEYDNVVQRYIINNPNTLHELPTITIENAIRQAYPCVVNK